METDLAEILFCSAAGAALPYLMVGAWDSSERLLAVCRCRSLLQSVVNLASRSPNR